MEHQLISTKHTELDLSSARSPASYTILDSSPSYGLWDHTTETWFAPDNVIWTTGEVGVALAQVALLFSLVEWRAFGQTDRSPAACGGEHSLHPSDYKVRVVGSDGRPKDIPQQFRGRHPGHTITG